MAAAATATSDTRASHDRMTAARSRLPTARAKPKADDRAPCRPQKAAPAPTTIGATTSERRLMSNATSRSTAGPGSTGVRRSASSMGASLGPALCPGPGRIDLLHLGLVRVVGLGSQPDYTEQEEH